MLLTRKLPTFLSRVNEISGGCENIAPVSGFLQYFKVVKDDGFYWVIVRVNGILAFFPFCDVCSADCRSVC